MSILFNFIKSDSSSVTSSFDVLPVYFPSISASSILTGDVINNCDSPISLSLSDNTYKVENNTRVSTNTWFVNVSSGSLISMISGSTVTGSVTCVAFNLKNFISVPLSTVNVDIWPVNTSVMWNGNFVTKDTLFLATDTNGQLTCSLVPQPYNVLVYGHNKKNTSLQIFPSGSFNNAADIVVSGLNTSTIINPFNSASLGYTAQVSDARYVLAGGFFNSASFAATASYAVKSDSSVSASWASSTPSSSISANSLKAIVVSSSVDTGIYSTNGNINLTTNISKKISLAGNNGISLTTNTGDIILTAGTISSGSINLVTPNGLTNISSSIGVLVNGGLAINGNAQALVSLNASSSISSSYALTASYATNAVPTVSASWASASVSSSYAKTASVVTDSTVVKTSFGKIAGYTLKGVTLEEVDSPSIDYDGAGTFYGQFIGLASNATTASYATSASYASNSKSASFATNSSNTTSASIATTSKSSSYAVIASNANTAAYASNTDITVKGTNTATVYGGTKATLEGGIVNIASDDFDIVLNSQNSIYLTSSNVNGVFSNQKITAPLFVGTSSWATNAVTAKTASFVSTASYALNGGTNLTTASTYPITASWAVTASYAANAIPTVSASWASASIIAKSASYADTLLVNGTASFGQVNTYANNPNYTVTISPKNSGSNSGGIYVYQEAAVGAENNFPYAFGMGGSNKQWFVDNYGFERANGAIFGDSNGTVFPIGSYIDGVHVVGMFEVISSNAQATIMRFGKSDYSYLLYFGIRYDLGYSAYEFYNESGLITNPMLSINSNQTGNGFVGINTANTSSARLHVIDTAEQLRLGYNSSNYLSTTVGSNGSTTFNATGTNTQFIFNQSVASPSHLWTGSYTTALTSSVTASAAYNGKTIVGNSVNFIYVNIPSTLPQGFSCQFYQSGSGKIILTGNGVSLNNCYGNSASYGQYAEVTLKQIDSSNYLIKGDTSLVTGLIPAMTSNTVPTGYIASGSGDLGDSYKAFDRNTGTSWGGIAADSWVQIQLTGSVAARQWYLNGTGAGLTFTYSLSGSNDGSTWTPLDNNTVVTPATLTRGFVNNTAYSYYRFGYHNAGGTSNNLLELQLYT